MSIDQLNYYGDIAIQYVSTHHTTGFALAGGALCALATAELAIRTLHDLVQILFMRPAIHENGFKTNFFLNLTGTVLFGACATNAIPGIAAAGAVLLGVNALLGDSSNNALRVTQAMREGSWKLAKIACVVAAVVAYYKLVLQR